MIDFKDTTKKIILVLFCIVFFVSNGFSQVRKYSNEFLAIGVGARSLGMSNANIVSVNDATAGYWNPAGLLEVKSDLQVSLMHSEYFAGIANYDFAAIAKKIDTTSAIGFSFIRLGVDNIANTIDLIDPNGNVNYNLVSTFSVADYAFLFSYAKKLSIPGLSVGANVKVIRRVAGNFASSWGFGLDIGAKYNYKKWRFAAMARDVTSTYNVWSFDVSQRMAEVFALTNNEIVNNSVELTLPKLILGASRQVILKNKLTLLTEVNADLTFDGKRNVLIKSSAMSIDPHFGMELGYAGMVFLRGGVMNIQRINANVGNRQNITFQPNIGVGLKIKNFTIDYAFTDIGDKSVGLYSHVFSLKLDFFKYKK